MPLKESHFLGRAVTQTRDTLDGEELAKYPGLQRRNNGIWYVRKRVPVDIMHAEPRSNIRWSLDTSDKKRAIQRYPFKLAEIEKHFSDLRNRLQSAGRVDAALTVGKLEALSDRDVEKLVSDWWATRVAIREPTAQNPDEIQELVADIESDARVLGTKAGDSDIVRGLADRLLVDAGTASRPHRVGKIRTVVQYPAVDRSTPAYHYLCELVERALRTEIALATDHLRSEQAAPFDPLFNSMGVRKGNDPTTASSRMRLGDVINEYRTERRVLEGETKAEAKLSFPLRVMEEALGRDKIASSIGRAELIEVKNLLSRIPPNATKRFPKLSLIQAADKAASESLPTLSPGSVSKYMRGILTMLLWAEAGGLCQKINTRGLVGRRKTTVKRRGFRADEMRILFDALDQYRDREPAKYWVPALAAFTGARANEICQLRVEDIEDVEGIPALNLSLFDKNGVRVEDKSLKTEASERYVPLHPSLIDAGFLTFVATQRSEERLFPALKRGPDGRYSHGFSKWFGRFKKKVGFDQPALVFHSFRHGFRDACRRADISDETSRALGGWTTIDQASDYGERAMVPLLDRAIKKLDFEGFTLCSSTGCTP